MAPLRTRAEVVRVGIFVVVALTILGGGLLWIAGSRFFRPVDTYTVLFEGSVSGLNASANVEYQGVVVGRVRDIYLTSNLPPKVGVTIDVEPGTPIRQDTVAALLGSFVTGVKFIQLQGGSEAAPPLAPGGTIHGDVASLEQFRDQLADIADRATKILRTLDERVFTPENSQHVTEFVADLGEVAKTLRTTLETFRTEQTGKDVAQLVRELSETTRSLHAVIDDFYGRRDTLFGNLEKTIRHLDEAIAESRTLLKSTQSQVAGSSTSFGTLVGELNETTTRLRETLDVIRSNPSVLLWGQPVPEREFKR